MGAATLSRRLFLLTSLWAVIAITLVGLLIGQIYRSNAERRFSELVIANLYNLMGSVETDAQGRLVAQPDFRDPRYSRFGSGWYWSVRSLSDPQNRVTSPSLADGEIPLPETVPLDDNFQRVFTYIDERGVALSGVEAQVFLGSGDEIYSFRATGNLSELENELSGFQRTLFALLVALAIGFIAASYAIVRIGLRPISGATRRLADIRDGAAERIEGDYPAEIQPLIDETNALIESNRAVIERARTQVGNLAHSLKTPLAVLRNEAKDASPDTARLIAEQTGIMNDQIQSYLNRARIAARHGTVTSRTDVQSALERLRRVIAKLNPDLQISVGIDAPDEASLAFAGEQQDFEEIVGNLLENAARFARSTIEVSAAAVGNSPNELRLRLCVEDDGPGMTAAEREIAVRRGARIDESQPGSGLGLSIVNEIAGEYGGRLALEDSALGGLRAVVELPAR